MGERGMNIFPMKTVWDFLIFMQAGCSDDQDRNLWIQMFLMDSRVDADLRREEFIEKNISAEVVNYFINLLAAEIQNEAEKISGGATGSIYRLTMLKGREFLLEICAGAKLSGIPAHWFPSQIHPFGSLGDIPSPSIVIGNSGRFDTRS